MLRKIEGLPSGRVHPEFDEGRTYTLNGRQPCGCCAPRQERLPGGGREVVEASSRYRAIRNRLGGGLTMLGLTKEQGDRPRPSAPSSLSPLPSAGQPRKGWVLPMLASKLAVRGSGPASRPCPSARLTASQGREDGSEEQGLGQAPRMPFRGRRSPVDAFSGGGLCHPTRRMPRALQRGSMTLRWALRRSLTISMRRDAPADFYAGLQIPCASAWRNYSREGRTLGIARCRFFLNQLLLQHKNRSWF